MPNTELASLQEKDHLVEEMKRIEVEKASLQSKGLCLYLCVCTCVPVYLYVPVVTCVPVHT